MEINLALYAWEKFAVCPECGSVKLGNGKGTLNVEDETFKRTCKCGFKICCTSSEVSEMINKDNTKSEVE